LLRADRYRSHHDEHDGHRREQGPSLAAIADHHADRMAASRRNQQDGEHLQEIGQRCRILIRVRGVGMVEAVTVPA